MGSARLQWLAFAVGLAGFAALLLAGFYRSVVLEHGPPPLSNDYGSYINDLARHEDWEAVLRELRLSATLDLAETRIETEVIPNLVRVARRLGDRQSELLAWRTLARRRPADASSHARLAWGLLAEPRPPPGRLREAALHGNWSLALGPASPLALVSLGRVDLLEGRREQGLARWREAAALDPAATERLLAALRERDAQAVDAPGEGPDGA